MIRAERKRRAIWLFLIGLGFQTQVHFFGSIGISELILFVVAPLIFVLDYQKLRADGFLPMTWFSFLCCVGCVVSGVYNDAYYLLTLKRLATVYSMFAFLVVMHRLLRSDLSALKYLLIGNFISSFICIFVFQQETYVFSAGELKTGSAATEAVMSYALFWSGKISNLLKLPVNCFYMNVPIAYSVFAPILSSVVFLIFSDASGRSAAAASAGAALLIFTGRRSASRIRKIGNRFAWLLLALVVALGAVKVGYAQAAKSGLLGDAAFEKYERQTQMGSGVLSLLMAGRLEFFVSMRAALDRPFLGWGPRPLDEVGYHADYLKKYGAPEDYDAYQRMVQNLEAQGFHGVLIPQHSVIASAWLTSGIVGLLFWLGVLWKIFSYFRYYACAVPQYFGFLSIFCCNAGWDIFFSGQSRFNLPIMLTCILLVRAVYKKKILLPPKMVWEIVKNDR